MLRSPRAGRASLACFLEDTLSLPQAHSSGGWWWISVSGFCLRGVGLDSGVMDLVGDPRHHNG